MKVLRSASIISLVLFLFMAAVSAQEKAASGDVPNNVISATTYTLSTQTGFPLLDMSSGTTQLIAGGTDDAASLEAPIGFIFRLDGVNYTTFGAHGNGFIRLGRAVDNTFTWNNTFSTGSNFPKIMPYWDDLCVGDNGKVHYKTIGFPGARIMVIEWKGMNVRKGEACDGSGSAAFQIWLYETYGDMQFIYGGAGTTLPPELNGGYSVGIQAGTPTSFASITTLDNTISYTVANNTNKINPAAGLSYRISPRPVAGPVGGMATDLTLTSVRLNWIDFPATETGYIIRRSKDNINFEIVGQLPANSTTFVDSGLEPNTHYTYRVNAVNEGQFSDTTTITADTLVPREIVSQGAGGLWSQPSTWVNGIVPTATDNVTIANGSTVIIDTVAFAINLTVGSGAAAAGKGQTMEAVPAVLRFGETAGFSLNVTNDITIGAGHTFSTGGGNANAHVLTLQGDLINNGTLDFSTNNNQAGALIVFQGSTSSVFGGSGPVTDIMWMRLEKQSKDDIVDLSVDNFTVQGATETLAFGFLILNGGTFKISGTFEGTHKTFISNAYDIAPEAGLWLNNPNYTIVAQHQSEVNVHGNLRVSAGTYNIGTETDDSIRFRAGSAAIVEGGNINIAGRLFGNDDFSQPFYYTQTGGNITTCAKGQTSTQLACFEMRNAPGSVQIVGGNIVIQNATPGSAFDYRYEALPDLFLSDATVQFGSASSSGPGDFRSTGDLPNLVLYDENILQITSDVRNIDIGPGARLTGAFTFHGDTFVNNGTFSSTQLTFSNAGYDQTYTGSGVIDGAIGLFTIRNDSLILDSVNTFRVRRIEFSRGVIINADKFTLGNGDSAVSSVIIYLGTPGLPHGFDVAPVFDLGTGGQSVAYFNFSFNAEFFTTGVEINPSRTLVNFSYKGSSSAPDHMTLDGGDIVVNGVLSVSNGVLFTGGNKIIHSGTAQQSSLGYVDGTIVRPFTTTGPYTFHVGQNGYSPVTLDVSNLGGTPPSLAVTAVDATLPGLLPATSVSRYWILRETGFMTGTLSFTYLDSDIRGSEANYKLARTEFGSPSFPPGCILFPDINTFNTPSNISFINGDWGIGAQLDPGPVSISGSVTTSGGQPIRNALLTISGGNLPSPISVQTGNFGTYGFTNLQAGETYTVRVDVKRYRFAQPTQLVTPMDNVGNVNFVANPQE